MTRSERKNGKANDYHICTRCVMDTTDPAIHFDESGICNHCKIYDERVRDELYLDDVGQQKLRQIIGKIKKAGENRKYDCVIGLSGGLDSSLALFNVKRLGLRPLAIHLDNGWNTEVSMSNVEGMVNKLGVDLNVQKVDWDEFKNIQLAFLKASIANAEIPTDHAIIALLFHTAAKRGIKYIISGGNIVTESIMPESWMYDAIDLRFIRAVHERFGPSTLTSFPTLNLVHWIYYTFIRGIRYFPILNYVPYVKSDARQLMEEEFGWKDYGGKHYESVYTRFFQGYILPKKFNIDKRRAHFSTLINSGQMTRKEALQDLKKDPYPSSEMVEDKSFILKKLGLTESDFEKIMELPVKSHKDYPNNEFLYNWFSGFVAFAKRLITMN